MSWQLAASSPEGEGVLKRDGMECDDVVGGEAREGVTGGSGKASGLGRDGQIGDMRGRGDWGH